MKQLTIQVYGNDEDQEQLMVNELTDIFTELDGCVIYYDQDVITMDLCRGDE